MPYWRLMYDWDNNYTKKEKRMILLTQEAIDKINWLTPLWSWSVFVTGEEYNALPSSKLTDGVEYIIIPEDWLMNYRDVYMTYDLWTTAQKDTVLAELNSKPNDYIDYYISMWYIYLEDEADLWSWKYLRYYVWDDNYCVIHIYTSNATRQEIIDFATSGWASQSNAEALADSIWIWQWIPYNTSPIQ